jgi:hypothetical protein
VRSLDQSLSLMKGRLLHTRGQLQFLSSDLGHLSVIATRALRTFDEIVSEREAILLPPSRFVQCSRKIP